MFHRFFGSKALAVHFKDLRMMSQPVQQGGRHAFALEHLAPVVEHKVAGDQQTLPLVAKVSTHLRNRHQSSPYDDYLHDRVHPGNVAANLPELSTVTPTSVGSIRANLQTEWPGQKVSAKQLPLDHRYHFETGPLGTGMWQSASTPLRLPLTGPSSRIFSMAATNSDRVLIF